MQKTANPIIAGIILCLVCAIWVVSNAEVIELPVDNAEQQLLTVIKFAENDKWDQASALAGELHADYPKFRAAGTLRRLVMNQQLPALQNPLRLNEEDDEYLPANLEAELSLRLQANRNKVQTGLLPDAILKLDGDTPYAILMDLSAARLFLLQNKSDTVTVLADYYAGIGKQGVNKQRLGDLRTPIGIYDITHEMSDAELDELYGVGALPLDYPNIWDRRLKRSGGGIWIHGVPRSTYSRPPYSSRGCVTLSNAIFSGLRPFITPGETPVILDDNVEWVEPGVQQALLRTIQDQLQQWQTDWGSLDFDRYISHYSRQFQSGGEDLPAWKKRKHAVNRQKTYIRINLQHVSVYRYPGETSLLQIDYHQLYESNSFNASADKRQYWTLEEDGYWRIVYEGLRRGHL